MTGARRGRVLARTSDALLLRCGAGEDMRVTPAGDAAPGDLVEIRHNGEAPRVVRAYRGGDFPPSGAETVRLGRRRRANLEVRARVLAAVREFFAHRGFLEVETPLLVPAPGLEPHLNACPAGDGAWLITSPEYQMKRLLVAGLERIYSLGKCFRAGERGSRHEAEFTMLEWYRLWSDLDDVRRDTEDLVAHVAAAVNQSAQVRAGGRPIDVHPPWPRMTVREAWERFAGVELRGGEAATSLRERLLAAGIEVGAARHWDELFFTAFVDRVEPALAARGRPIFLLDWPVELGTLARRKPADSTLVDRFEAYVGDIELANAFGELTDPGEQRQRLLADQQTRSDRGLPVYPLDDRFLAAVEEGLPPCAGVALGVDRLVMLVTGATEIRDVLAFAGDEL